jgi:gamma-glutamyltranspeptidase
MISMALKLLVDDMKLPEAVDAARFYAGSSTRTAYAEDRASSGATARLEADGYRVVRVPAIGRVNAIWCRGGVPREKKSCRFAVDKRGFGYAVSAER